MKGSQSMHGREDLCFNMSLRVREKGASLRPASEN